MADGGDKTDIEPGIDPVITINDRPDLEGDETATVGVVVENTHVSVALNEALEQVKDHPYRPGELLHEQIRYELNLEGYEIEAYSGLEIEYRVADELELGEVAFEIEVCDVGVFPDEV